MEGGNHAVELSLCVIVKDEEDWIEWCVNNAKDFVDEIVIVDTGSDDSTIPLIRKMQEDNKKVKLFDFEWGNHAAKSRNFAVSKTRGEWVLSLDADEMVSPKDFPMMRELIKKKDVDGYKLEQRNYSNEDETFDYMLNKGDYKEAEGYSGWGSSMLVRLFRNKGYQFRYRVHEIIEPDMREKGGVIRDSGIPMHHYKDRKGRGKGLEFSRNYIEWAKLQIKDTPDDPKPHYEVGIAYMKNAEYAEAEPYIKKAAELGGETRHFMSLAELHLHMGRLEESERIVDKLLDDGMQQPGLWVMKATILLKRGSEKAVKQAKEMLLGLLEKGVKDPVALNNLAVIFIGEKKMQKATECMEMSYSLKRSTKTAKNLAALYAELGKKEEGLKLIDGKDENWTWLYRGIFKVQAGNEEEGIRFLEKGIEIDPENHQPYLNLGIVFLNRGEKDKAKAYFKKAIKRKPGLEPKLKEHL